MLMDKYIDIFRGKFAAGRARLAVLFYLFFLVASVAYAATPTSVQFTATSINTASASWALDDPDTQSPLVVLSLVSDFSTTIASGTMALGSQATTYFSLTANTTYWFKVKVSAEGDVNYSAAISTVTRIETPGGLVFDVSISTIVASALGNPDFTNLGAGLSATNIAKDGTYAGWHEGGDTWSARTSMPRTRRYLATAEVGGKIYAIGGYSGSARNYNEEYDPVANSWDTKTAMTTARYGLAAVAVSGKIYALGGQGGTNKNEEYDPVANGWTAKTAMTTGRRYFAAAVVGGKIYAIGGAHDSSQLSEVNEE